jgi:two-component system invasion response regulator UvrY
MAMIRVMLVDDHAVVRAGFRRLIETMADMEVVGEAASGEEACRQAATLRPDVVVLDISMPGIGGLETIGRLARVAPEARVLVLSVHENEPFPSLALERGASGYLTKRCAPEELITAVRELAHGRKYLASDVARRIVLGRSDGEPKRLASLSPRELEVFGSLARGRSVNEIAANLNLSPKTVHVHRANLLAKLGVKTTAELVALAVRHGVLDVTQAPG